MVAIVDKVYCYDFTSFSLICAHETLPNAGILALTPAPQQLVHVAALDKEPGRVWLGAFLTENTLAESRVVEAHASAVAALAFNQEATLMATCSEKGTILRLFAVADAKLVKELRRGTDYAEIRCLAFSLDSTLLACSSDKGTVHLFAVPAEAGPCLLYTSDAADE